MHFKIGKIKLEEAVLKNGEISMYKVTFFGDTLTLTELIGEDKIDSLEWLNNFNHSGSNANVKVVVLYLVLILDLRNYQLVL